ncbi:MAG: TIGR02556 family CRISPR-associated protein [Methanophagales archaeon ANME-1-THS]|nr:MAG: TIGR02556 family CRISPR-associated protein [Methanophagales archaeon ANME-1-THS]
MIEAIRRVGEYAQKEGRSELLNIFIENPNKTGRYKRVLLVVLNEVNGDYAFSRVELEDFKGEGYEKYLYKLGSKRGTDVTPTSKVAGNIETTFQIKFLKWFENDAEYVLSEEEKERIRKMREAIEAQKDLILSELKEKSSQMKKGENAIITLGIEKDGDTHYIADFPVFQNILLQKGKEKYYYQKSKGLSVGKNSTCSVCKEKKEEVYGLAVPWTFHTFDKPGFIAGGFNFADSWKNTPVCFDCATCLELGRKYVEEKLDFDFYGFRYLFIPKLTVKGDYDEILNILEDYKKEVKLNREVRSQITSDENEILRHVAKERNFFNNNFLFYKIEQSAFRILLFIEGVLPSRLNA